MDFFEIKERSPRKGVLEIWPDFKVTQSKDLMIRAKSVYAIWDEKVGLWSTNSFDVRRLVDEELIAYRDKVAAKMADTEVRVKLMESFSSKSWVEFGNFLARFPDSSHQLDMKLTFQNTEVKKKDYVSKRLPYPLEEGKYDAFDEIIGTLYEPEERAKLEWAIGSIVAGDAKDIQKFVVLYGEAGAGKSTILNIIQKLFEGYYTMFEAKALTSSSNSFSTEVFRSNPLVAIQHDGDLSRIEDNTKLNSIISHEEMTMNEKYKPSYTAKANCFLFMATNQPVKIGEAKSGIIRRLIDVRTSGRRIPAKKYQALMAQVDFELGAIAYHCLSVYREMGKNYYSAYRPLDMILKTDVFFNFVEENFHIFKELDGVSLAQAYAMYKTYCDESSIEMKYPKYKFRDELKNYFVDYLEVKRVDDKVLRNYYCGFISAKFTSGEAKEKDDHASWLVLDSEKSIFDEVGADFPAQYASERETPTKKWSTVKTHLSDIDTTRLHYVIPPLNHIVIDFDIQDESGEKSAAKNLEAASKWPPTYAEFSKSQAGLHLHYIYDGDTDKLRNIYDEGIEIKVFRVGPVGPSALRRKLSKCNNIPIATINSGLPLKGEKMINFDSVKNERAIRTLIAGNLNKEYQPGTKPSIDFIKKILDDAYANGLKYDVTDMRPKVMAFAANSTHQAELCLNLVSQMRFQSEEPSVNSEEYPGDDSSVVSPESDTLVFFDVEVFSNLLLVSWKYAGEGNKCVRMINPTSQEIEALFKMKLVGFNCRRYDNHILYARFIGYTNQQIYEISQRIISESRNAMFGEAYGISYTDVYDFASAANKKSLKKFEIELGIHHKELGLPWDKPVPEDQWDSVGEYCDNDVIATEATFKYLSGDWTARQILAKLSGLTVNDTTNQHSTKIIFGEDKDPQSQFVYTDLSIMFPGYKFEGGKSSYRGEDPGEGGYVYAEPGLYLDVALSDVASMHPTSIEELNLFGSYTKIFSEIKSARIAIKHNDRKAIETLLGGRLIPFMEKADLGEFTMSDLSTALKTVLNSVYGLTSASFANKFRDPRNVDNIVAKRGALFMIDLKHAVQEKGFTVAHIKTDSIKIPNATPEIIQFVSEFGKKYGYVFEHEATYDRFLLVNDAVYIARYKDGKHAGEWVAVGTQFQQPYVFKTLFSKESIVFEDMCETKSVTTALYLDMNESMPEGEHNYVFIGKTGSFCPIKPGLGGGLLCREKDGRYYAATGSKGFRWMEAEVVKSLGKEKDIDEGYYQDLVDAAIKDISVFADIDWLRDV